MNSESSLLEVMISRKSVMDKTVRWQGQSIKAKFVTSMTDESIKDAHTDAAFTCHWSSTLTTAMSPDVKKHLIHGIRFPNR